jgi:hypothetical protein
MATVIEETSVCANTHYRKGKERSGVSWGAVIAGALASAILTLLLLILGTGLGFSAVSPWANEGASAEAIGISTVVWITLVSLLASAIGGYMAGRLRPRWNSINTDEVYFRDTAHGFLSWALSTLLMATLLASAVGSVVSGGAKLGAVAAGAAAGGAGAVAANDERNSDATSGNLGQDYLFDTLFRPNLDAPRSEGVSIDSNGQPQVVRGDEARAVQHSRVEATRIFFSSLKNDGLSPEDSRYLSRVVAREAGISQQEAEVRVNDAYAKLNQAKEDAKVAADKAASAAAYAALWMFVSLLIGAFIASLCATRGGRCRDSCDLNNVSHTTTRVETHPHV